MKRKLMILLAGLTLSLMLGCDGKGGDTLSQTGETSQITETSPAQDTSEEGNSGSGDESTDATDVSSETKESESSEMNESSENSESKDTESMETTEGNAPTEEYVPDRSEAFELLSHIKIGWNLGNTLDAHGAGNSLKSETYWGNPKTTQEMIDAVAAQGFNAIRIPVTYAEHMVKSPELAIKEEWLDRVQEVVDYAMNAGMYVVLDTHHETDYWLKTDAEHEESANEELAVIWKQVAERFRDYDEKLIFEGMNEPRLKGSANEWNGGTAKERKMVDRWNKTFVDTVRATGGNNETRLLIICTYGNNPSIDCILGLAIPNDDHIAVAVHMYTPYYFTFDDPNGGFSNWDGSQKSSITGTIKQLDRYLLQKDVPVIVTEFGAVNKKNTDDVTAWIADYLGAMNEYGIKCFWWDNNCYETNGENFGIFNRRELSWYNQKIADALIENSTAK